MFTFKVSQPFNMQLILTVRKLWSFGKDERTVKYIFISKLQITENQRKLDVPEKSKVLYDFKQKQFHEGNKYYVSKRNLDVPFVKGITRSNILKGKCKMNVSKLVFRSFLLHLFLTKLYFHLVYFYQFLTGISPTLCT